MVTILVVDDHELVRTGIARVLDDQEGVRVIGQAGSGEEALELAIDLEPDVVLMDVRMPGIGGLEATRRMVRLDDGLRVIAVTVCEEEPFPSRLLRVGASGYIGKGADVEEMMYAIKVVCRGQRYISPNIAQTMALRAYDIGESAPVDLLSERELQIMMILARGHSVQDAADELSLSPKTVNTYRYRIFEKLYVSCDVQLALMAMRHGMIDADDLTFV